jgi:hypothetical protein
VLRRDMRPVFRVVEKVSTKYEWIAGTGSPRLSIVTFP